MGHALKASRKHRFSKRVRDNAKARPEGAQSVEAAVAVLRKFKAPKFDQTVEISLSLGIDTKQADQAVRGSVALPHGVGKSKRVIAFCTDDLVKDALAAGAVKAGGEALVAEVEKGFLDFDVAVASPDMMRVVSRLGRALGPKGLMPSPKSGTVTPKIVDAVKEYSAGKVEYRADKVGGNVQAAVGKMSFTDAQLADNIAHFIQTIENVRPSAVKGEYIKKVVVSGAMTPSVEIQHTAAAVDE